MLEPMGSAQGDHTGRRGRRARRFDLQILLSALVVGLPGVLVTLLLLWLGDYTGKTRWTLTLLVGLAWIGLAFVLRRRVVHPLYALANLLEAIRIGDYSLRARRAVGDDALAQVLREVNALRDHLWRDRLGAREATALLERVVEEIEVAVFAFDAEGRLRLVNRAGERLLDRSAERLLGRTAAGLGLAELLAGDAYRIVELAFPGAEGRWAVRRRTFRQDGRPHRLLVVADLSRTLREEERQAWRRLIRVLGHELNNSLAPIKSMSGTLATLLERRPRPEDWEDDMRQGLDVICNRSEALARFLAAYSRLARLPPPSFSPTRVADLVRRVAALETRREVEVVPGPELTVVADADQLEQLLINLVRNAVDATRETGGRVWVGWRYALDAVELWVRDEGPGLSNPDNLFVPFYTTKPGGTGIGLVLCRQIAEAHGGSLVLANHPEGGCEARLRLPFLAGGALPGVRQALY
ncbi:MAG TPA: ATP-binding protein [Thermoanaerobaculia bacterium]|nr:ATP-binding protein [Thermoanaerobaculia bacterium]